MRDLLKEKIEEAKGIIQTINDNVLKKIEYEKAWKWIKAHPKATLAATAGLGLLLFSRAIGHKKYEQAEY